MANSAGLSPDQAKTMLRIVNARSRHPQPLRFDLDPHRPAAAIRCNDGQVLARF
jgi:hypothetical protein